MQNVIKAKLYLRIKGLLNFTKTSKSTRIAIENIEKNIFSKSKFIYLKNIIYIHIIKYRNLSRFISILFTIFGKMLKPVKY